MIGAFGLVSCVSLLFAMPINEGAPKVQLKNVSTQKISQKIQQVMRELQIKKLEEQVLNLKLQQLRISLGEAFSKSLNRQYKWTKGVVGKVPKNAVVAWKNVDGPINICQADYRGGVHPGQLTKQGCKITYGWKAFNESTFKVLTSKKDISWQRSSKLYRFQYQNQRRTWPIYGGVGPVMLDGNIQELIFRPVIGGHEAGHNIYICRAMYQNDVHVGKVVSSNCNIGVAGKEIRVPDYEVLFQNVAIKAQEKSYVK